MQRAVILVTFIAIFVNLRTFTLLFGKFSETVDLKNMKWMIASALLLDVCGFHATRKTIFVIAAGALCLVMLFLEVKRRQKNQKKLDEVQFIDNLVMQMRSGMSFENALQDGLKTFFAKNSVFDGAEHLSTYGQNSKLGQILKRCEQNASQSFKILTSYRSFLRIRDRLHRKHANVTMQARAQAAVCAGLFFVILAAEWTMFPNFVQFLSTSWGRLTLVVTLSLLVAGEKSILALSKPRELDL